MYINFNYQINPYSSLIIDLKWLLIRWNNYLQNSKLNNMDSKSPNSNQPLQNQAGAFTFKPQLNNQRTYGLIGLQPF